jgi:predicted ATPase
MPLFERFRSTLFENGEFRPKIPASFMTELISLAPIRTTPQRTYDRPQTSFSPEGKHTPYIIKKRLSSTAQAAKFRQFLERAGHESGLFKSVRVKSFGKTPLAPFEVQIILDKTPLALEDVGYGVSQALPVLVEMFDRPKRTAFSIQQPEVHLHPRAQAAMGDLIAELARSEEKRFFIETHSDFLIDRFRMNIRRHGKVGSQVLFFERTPTGTRALSIPIGEDGNLPDNQPDQYRSFFINESLNLLS